MLSKKQSKILNDFNNRLKNNISLTSEEWNTYHELKYKKNMEHCSFSLRDDHKYYFANQIKECGEKIIKRNYLQNPKRTGEKIVRVEFGKQDIRGSFAITCIDTRNCVPDALYFKTKDQLLGFVQGFNHI